jgi:hypothetical protein
MNAAPAYSGIDAVFGVPDGHRWDDLCKTAKQTDIGQRIDAAMDAIEKENPSLRGVLPKRYARRELTPAMLGGLIDTFSRKDLAGEEHKGLDVPGVRVLPRQVRDHRRQTRRRVLHTSLGGAADGGDAGTGTDRVVDPGAEIDTAVKQSVSEHISGTGVIDIYAETGLEQPDLSLIDEYFIDRFRRSDRPNLQIDMLKRLLSEAIKVVGQRNLVAGRKFSEMLANSVLRYQNHAPLPRSATTDFVADSVSTLVSADASRSVASVVDNRSGIRIRVRQSAVS